MPGPLPHNRAKGSKQTLPALSAAAPTAPVPAPATALGFGPGLTNVDGAPANLRTIQPGDRFIAFLGVGHFHKTEATRAAGRPVGHDADAIDLAIGFENSAEVIFPCVEIQVTNENVLHVLAFLASACLRRAGEKAG